MDIVRRESIAGLVYNISITACINHILFLLFLPPASSHPKKKKNPLHYYIFIIMLIIIFHIKVLINMLKAYAKNDKLYT